MSLFSRAIRRIFSPLRVVAKVRPLVWSRPRKTATQGKYDAAQLTETNAAHWQNADALSAEGANTVSVRYTLRNRSRYEAANNGYFKGLLRTRRNDIVGTGPRMQVGLPDTYIDPDFGTVAKTPKDAARMIEKRFRAWMKAADIATKLRIMVEAGERDGEIFGVYFTDPQSTDAVWLNLRLIEPDQCTTPGLVWNDPTATDGIKFDEYGNPVEYHFLKAHPGDPIWFDSWEYDAVSAQWVIHWYDPDRANQRRGIPALTPSLPLFSQMRRYTLATLTAAETAANIAGIMYTDQPPPSEGGNPPTFEEFDSVPIHRGSLLTAPMGWRAESFKAEQPTSTYREFKAEILAEAGRCVVAPRNVATGSSAEYNYSSGRLDHLPWQRSIAIERDRIISEILERLFRAWHHEARLIPGYLPYPLPPVEEWERTWHWDGFPSIDPVKEATADEIGLKNGTRTLTQIYAERGEDWEDAIRQKAREIRLARQLEAENGLAEGTLYPLAEAAKPLPQAAPPAPLLEDAPNGQA